MTSKILWRLHVSNQVGSVVTNKVTTDPSWFVSLRSLHSQGIQSRAHAEEKLDTSACRMFFVSCCFIIFMVIISLLPGACRADVPAHESVDFGGEKKDQRDGTLRDRSFFIMIVICIRVRWFLLFLPEGRVTDMASRKVIDTATRHSWFPTDTLIYLSSCQG